MCPKETHPSEALSHIETAVSGERAGAEAELLSRVYVRFFEGTNIGLAITLPDGSWERVNPHLCKMLCYSEEALTQRTWQELTYPDDLEPDLQKFRRVLAGEIDSYEMNKRFLRSDGSTLHTHLSVAVDRDEFGNPKRFFATLVDRGGEQQALDALHLSEQRFRLLTESTLDGVWDWDIAAGTLWLSSSWKAQLGYRNEELDNAFETWSRLLHPDDHGRVLTHVRSFLEHPSAIWQETFSLAHRDGGWRQILARAIPVFGASDKPIRMVGVHVDITSEREAISELRSLNADMEKRLKRRTAQVEAAQTEIEGQRLFVEAILNATQALIVVLDTDANVVIVNPVVESILGWRPRELIGKNWIDTCLPVADRDLIRRVFRRALTDERTRGYENLVLTKAGETRYIRWYDELLEDEPGKPRFLVAAGIDVTEQRDAQQRLREANLDLEGKVQERTRALEAAQAAVIQSEKLASLGTMVAGISHEINNPLMGLTNYLDFAGDHTEGRVAEIIDKAKNELGRIGSVVDNLLNYARPRAAEVEQVEIGSTVIRALDLLRADFSNYGIGLDNRIPDDLPPVTGHAGSIQQVLLNLLINARDALAGSETRRITLRGGALESEIWLEVADSGPGIPLANRQRIFDPFFSTKAPGVGTGLGLAVSQGIISAMGGGLTLVDSTNPGAVFRLTLPRAEVARPA